MPKQLLQLHNYKLPFRIEKHTFESGVWLPSVPRFAMVLGLLLLGNASINFSTILCENADGENAVLDGKIFKLHFIQRGKSSSRYVNYLRIFLTWCASSHRDDNFLQAIEMKARRRGTCTAKTFAVLARTCCLHAFKKKFNRFYLFYIGRYHCAPNTGPGRPCRLPCHA